jgi:hypothetical protein
LTDDAQFDREFDAVRLCLQGDNCTLSGFPDKTRTVL